ncbi:MAG TPA: phosphatase PAP2 family protein, partial [Stellaceae bacterium]
VLWINGCAQHSYFFDRCVVHLADEGFLKGGVFFLFFWWLWFRHPDDPRHDRIDVLRIAGAICLAVILARALQILLPGRARPINDAQLAFVPPFTQTRGYLEHWSSFPSDHAVVFFALATAIWARYRLLGAFTYAWITLLALLPRLYTGLHYPSDLIAGAAIGTLVMAAADALPLPRAAMGFIEELISSERWNPAAFYCVAVAMTYEFIELFGDVRLVGRAVAKALF